MEPISMQLGCVELAGVGLYLTTDGCTVYVLHPCGNSAFGISPQMAKL